jgi:GNAT superfamily N-acetyltransferase
MAITTRPLSPRGWKDVEELFGDNGASGGCWCMFWRLGPGERFSDLKGAPLKGMFRALVQSGQVHAVLAYEGALPVGWLTYGPRPSFPRLDRARTLACADADRVWSLPCFFVRRSHRNRGVAKLLLAAALEEMRKRGVSLAEGYPVKPPAEGARLPPAFAYTGTRQLFEEAGFRLQPGSEAHSKQRMRRKLTRADRRRG